MLCAKPDGKVNASNWRLATDLAIVMGGGIGETGGNGRNEGGGPQAPDENWNWQKFVTFACTVKLATTNYPKKYTLYYCVLAATSLLLLQFSFISFFFGFFVCFVLLLQLQKFGYSSFCMLLPLWFFSLIFFPHFSEPFNLFFRIFFKILGVFLQDSFLGAVNENRRRHLNMKCSA